MKKQIALAAGLAVLAAPAFASKARLQALGEDIYGSQYINDNRNIFLNASAVNEYKDLVTMEWGDTTNATDASGSPRAEGGLFLGHGNMVYGVQLGRESNVSQTLRTAAGVTGTEAEEQNNIDLYVGGDAGVKWGAALYHSASKDETGAEDAEQKAMGVRLGASQGLWNAFANVSLTNEAEDAAGNEFDGDTGYAIGGGYQLNEYNIFAQYQNLKGENQDNDEVEAKVMLVGVGRVTRLNDKATLFTKVSYDVREFNNDGVAEGNGAAFAVEKTKDTQLPVVVGLEYDAASWLTLRGSLGQNVLVSKREQDDEDTLESTIVAAGASLKFGDLVVDGVIGNDADGDGAGQTLGTSGGNGTLRTDALMSRVAVTYKF